MRKVTIKEKEYVLRFSLRVLFVYEEIAGKPYDGKRLIDLYMLMYACLIANNETFGMEFAAFIDECDKDAALFGEFAALMEEESVKKSMCAATDKKKVASQ